MKFTDINPQKAGSEDAFLRLLQKTIDPSFRITKREVIEMYYGTHKILKHVSFKAIRDEKVLELNLMMSNGRICPITLSRLNVDTFYGFRWGKKTSKIFLKNMDSTVPILKEFLLHGIINEKIFEKVEGRKGDDWPVEIARPKAIEFPKRYARAVA